MKRIYLNLTLKIQCGNKKCEETLYTSQPGDNRIVAGGLKIRCDSNFDPDGDGYFITDKYGFWLRDHKFGSDKDPNPDLGEMLQYCKPGSQVNYPRGGFMNSGLKGGEYIPKRQVKKKNQRFNPGNGIYLGAEGKTCSCLSKNRRSCPCLQN